MFVGVVILFWILNGGVWCEKMCKETCRYFKGFAIKNFLKPLFLFWSYLGLGPPNGIILIGGES